jgi:hypothetical protein
MEMLLHWRTLILHRTIERKMHNWVSTSGNAPLKFNCKIITFLSSFFRSFLITHLYVLKKSNVAKFSFNITLDFFKVRSNIPLHRTVLGDAWSLRLQSLHSCYRASTAVPSWLCLEAVIKNLHETYQCRMYSRKLLMMDREDARNT